jgi:hypothetical protein
MLHVLLREVRATLTWLHVVASVSAINFYLGNGKA